MGNVFSSLFSLCSSWPTQAFIGNFNPTLTGTGDSGPTQRCAFLTDVEGNYEYFERYVDISRVLKWETEERKSLTLEDNVTFVFGGDSQDKGTGDIRFVKLMLDLKEKYPDRVFFIIGNRDANKLRFSTELSDEALKSEKVRTDPDFPYWIPKDKVVTAQAFYEANKLQDTPANRLKWILKYAFSTSRRF
jgi:hypothetical protein